jgi:hypothetical protein
MVQAVIDQVHAAGQQTEDQEGLDGLGDRPRVHRLLGEQQRGEDQQVLGPLPRAQSVDEVHE